MPSFVEHHRPEKVMAAGFNLLMAWHPEWTSLTDLPVGAPMQLATEGAAAIISWGDHAIILTDDGWRPVHSREYDIVQAKAAAKAHGHERARLRGIVNALTNGAADHG